MAFVRLWSGLIIHRCHVRLVPLTGDVADLGLINTIQ